MWKIFLVVVGLMLVASPVQSAQKEKPKKDVVEVSIKDRQFSPAEAKIKVGQTVKWTNNDDMDHSVDAKDGAFSSGTIKSKKSYEYTFAKKGKFAYSCKLHPRMKGTVTVE